MQIYDFLSGIGVAGKRYAFKFFLAACPLVLLLVAELIIIMMMGNGMLKPPYTILVSVLVLVTIGVAYLVFVLFNKMVAPVRQATQALDNYVGSRIIPELPLSGDDEAGDLLRGVQQTISKLEGLIVDKSDMVDLLSHDVRSPVGRILSLSSLIKMDDSSEKEMYADYISNECTGLLSMLENILLMLKEDSNVFRLEFINLNKLVNDTLSFYSFAAAEKNLTMEVNIDDRIYIPIQEQLFKQAIRNIIGNAIKFSPDGKTVNITGKQDADNIRLSIKDEGLGFKPNDMVKIFERFTTAGKKGTHGEASTGLGLYLSKKIVEKHGGKLLAESKGEHKGASFTIVLYRLVIKKPHEKMLKRRPATSVVAFRHR